MIVILMGVSGCGKTTVGRLLAESLGCPFHDADDDHPPANVEKMRRGEPLTEADRAPWFATLNGRLRQWSAEPGHVILACSALTRNARRAITAEVDPDAYRLVLLDGSADLLRRRLANRQHRYMPASLLDSQLATLERPEDAVVIDIDAEPHTIVEAIRVSLAI